MEPNRLALLVPSDRRWIFKEQSHVGVVCADIEKTIADYEKLGYTFALRCGTTRRWRPGLGVSEARDIRSAWSLQGPPHIEIAEVAGSGIEPLLWPRRGHDYVDHTGYWVDDLQAASAQLEDLGFPLEMTPAGNDGHPNGFCYHRSPGGIRIELEDGPMRKEMLREQLDRVRNGDTSVIEYRASRVGGDPSEL